MEKRPTTWFTSDSHFGHARIVELCQRPFPDVRAMDEAMIARWNARVEPGDVVWHVGDFAFGDDAARIGEVFARLNGVKHLVVGNHDEGKDEVLSLPWASVSVMARTIVDMGHVTMCHYPMKSWPKVRKGAVHLYGHMHGRLRGTSRSIDVGVDAWGFAPASLREIRQRLKALPPDPDFDEEVEDGARR